MPRLGRARGPGAADPQVHIAAVKPRASRSDVLYSGFGVGQKWSIADMCRSKNTLPKKGFIRVVFFWMKLRQMLRRFIQ